MRHFVCSRPLYELNVHTQMHSCSSSVLFTMCFIVGKLNHTKLVTNDLKRHIEKQNSTDYQWKLEMPSKPSIWQFHILFIVQQKNILKSCSTITSFFPSCTNTNTIAVSGRWHSCRRWLNSLPNDLVVTEFAQFSFFSLCFVSLVKTWRAFNCQNCDRRGRIVCKWCSSVQLKWKSTYSTRALTSPWKRAWRKHTVGLSAFTSAMIKNFPCARAYACVLCLCLRYVGFHLTWISN